MIKTAPRMVQVTAGPLLIGLKTYDYDNVWKVARSNGFLHVYAYRSSMTFKWGYTAEDLSL